MVFDFSVALTWVLFLALFPMAFIWLRRAWRILFKRDFSEVALKHGMSPLKPERWAPYELLINFLAGGIALTLIVGVALGLLDFSTWTAIGGSTLWCKIFASFALSRHAHAADGQAKA
jgi:hypothetical protein